MYLNGVCVTYQLNFIFIVTLVASIGHCEGRPAEQEPIPKPEVSLDDQPIEGQLASTTETITTTKKVGSKAAPSSGARMVSYSQMAAPSLDENDGQKVRKLVIPPKKKQLEEINSLKQLGSMLASGVDPLMSPLDPIVNGVVDPLAKSLSVPIVESLGPWLNPVLSPLVGQ